MTSPPIGPPNDFGYNPDDDSLTRFPPSSPPQAELESILKDYVGRANPLLRRAPTEHYGTADIYLKRRDLNYDRRRTRSTTQLPGAPRQEDGQEAHHRRDRRGSARRRDRHRVRALRPRVHHLHGRRGHGEAEAQRLPSPPRRHREPRALRHLHPQGCNLRGHPRLGDQRGPPTTFSAPSRVPTRTP